ncbi:bifunctional nicotinamidase/pyrazinamidase [Thalassospira xiamenensis]|uniref:nicotinamidase n=1 Tax=Thalassospira xiamenensis TaxID=220697 RepID=A0A285TSW6_9PROT|nr:bifunctional nicotinamidase/pyrazinamidase [Thalassospira xiamenensis]SOC26764.1 nicotinamidase/pyrazinamidase [Thalassospira xiamenensis]
MSTIELMQTDMLCIIDATPTFMPGGSLPVPNGYEILPVINTLLPVFQRAVAVEDWHPKDHSSFASNHPGKAPFDVVDLPYGKQVLWPDHAPRGTTEAKTHEDVDQSYIEAIIRKGFRKQVDSYSGFFENDQTTTTGLDAYLKARGIKRLFLVGLATDFCVAYTAEDATKLGYEVFLVEDGCRGIGMPTSEGKTTMDDAYEKLKACGVTFIQSSDISS